MPTLASGFHPDLVAQRFNDRRQEARIAIPDLPQPRAVEPAEGIPDDIMRAIEGQMTAKDHQELKRPRVILSTRLVRDSAEFVATEALNRLRGN